MGIINISYKNLKELKEHIKKHRPTLYTSSKTSTVIPFDNLDQIDDYYLGDLSTIPGEMKLFDGVLVISGGTTWQEAKSFARSKGRDIFISPTEESANVLAGVATSCTGEKSFSFGTLRDQVKKIIYLDFNGEEKTLSCEKPIAWNQILAKYQQDFSPYKKMKNGPFPRLEREIDLMIGMEGQLGVVTKIFLETTSFEDSQFLLIPIGKWEKSLTPHLDIFYKIQKFRDKILSCEFIDENSLRYLGHENSLPLDKDIIIVEIPVRFFEDVYGGFLAKLGIDIGEIVELSAGEYHKLRMDIPRKIQEENSRQGLIKKGTDAQVSVEHFGKLLAIYQEMGKKGIPYILFGHFGDGHLHFNFLPDREQVNSCEDYLKEFYIKIKGLAGSPFAEHGVGLIKQEFLRTFLGRTQFAMFKHLKNTYDPYNQFFPQGFLNL